MKAIPMIQCRLIGNTVIRRGSEEETGTSVVVCAISGVFLGATLVSRSGVRFSFTS